MSFHTVTQDETVQDALRALKVVCLSVGGVGVVIVVAAALWLGLFGRL